MTLAQASSTASSSRPTSASSRPACWPTAVTNSRMRTRFSVDEGTVSKKRRSTPANSALPDGDVAEAPHRRLEVGQNVEDLRKAEDLEGGLDLRNRPADLDVPALPANLLHVAHEDAQAGRRDVGHSGAVDDDLPPAGGELGHDDLLEPGRGVRVDVALESDDREIVADGRLDLEGAAHGNPPSGFRPDSLLLLSRRGAGPLSRQISEPAWSCRPPAAPQRRTTQPRSP